MDTLKFICSGTAGPLLRVGARAYCPVCAFRFVAPLRGGVVPRHLVEAGRG